MKTRRAMLTVVILLTSTALLLATAYLFSRLYYLLAICSVAVWIAAFAGRKARPVRALLLKGLATGLLALAAFGYVRLHRAELVQYGNELWSRAGTFWTANESSVTSGIVTSVLWAGMTAVIIGVYRRRRRAFAYANLSSLSVGLRERLVNALPPMHAFSVDICKHIDESVASDAPVTTEAKEEFIVRFEVMLDLIEAIVHWQEQINAAYGYAINCRRRTLTAARELKGTVDALATGVLSIKRTYNRFSDSRHLGLTLKLLRSTHVGEVLDDDRMDRYVLRERKAITALLYGMCFRTLQHDQRLFNSLPVWRRLKVFYRSAESGGSPLVWLAMGDLVLKGYPPDQASIDSLDVGGMFGGKPFWGNADTGTGQTGGMPAAS